MRIPNLEPSELGDYYIKQISENVELSRNLGSTVLNLTDYLDFIEESSENYVDASIEAMLATGSLSSESIRGMLIQYDLDQINAFAMGYFAIRGLTAAKQIIDGRELVLDPSGFKWETPMARLTVINPNAVRLHKSWRPLKSPYDELYSAKFLDIGRSEAGAIGCFDSIPTHGGILRLQNRNRLYPYHTIAGLVNPETGQSNVKLDIIRPRTSFADHQENE
ncbi:MAG TPA: hypothetical protein VFN31_03495 [Candidatus Saccharimonadales bacterium]|nr:hypothetical protein [Candidatus Saccharimonadales bacterium]